MADEGKYILDLAVATTVDDNALIIVQDADETKRMTFGAMKKVLGATGGTEATKLQEKSVTPTKQSQTIVPDYGYDGLSKITVKPISDDYIQPKGIKNITENGTYDVTEYASVGVEVQETTDVQIATSTTPGNVMPVAKTDEMTQEVGVDENGRLYTKPGADGSNADSYKVIIASDDTWQTLLPNNNVHGHVYTGHIPTTNSFTLPDGVQSCSVQWWHDRDVDNTISGIHLVGDYYQVVLYTDGKIYISQIFYNASTKKATVSGWKDVGGGTVDSELSTASTNPVQNKVIATQLGNIEAALDAMIEKAGGTV